MLAGSGPLTDAGLTEAGLTDAVLLRFAQSVELVVGQAYQAAAPLLTGPAADTAGTFARHHSDHAAAIARVSAEPPVTAPNPQLSAEVVQAVKAAHTARDALVALFVIEGNVAATYQYLLEHLTGDDALRQVSAVLPVESEHAAVIGLLLQKDPRDLGGPYETHDGAYDPARFPAP